jgi:hypothetical protein
MQGKSSRQQANQKSSRVISQQGNEHSLPQDTVAVNKATDTAFHKTAEQAVNKATDTAFHKTAEQAVNKKTSTALHKRAE